MTWLMVKLLGFNHPAPAPAGASPLKTIAMEIIKMIHEFTRIEEIARAAHLDINTLNEQFGQPTKAELGMYADWARDIAHRAQKLSEAIEAAKKDKP